MSFTEEEIALMRKIGAEIGLNSDFEHFSDDEWCDLTEAIGDYLVLRCLDLKYDPNAEGLLCEDILYKLAQD